jgi:tRNA nucleotidyltransferase/poly(A) polymerase
LQERIINVEPSKPLYLVGGAVRDALLRRDTKDIDLVTPSRAIELGRKIAHALKGEFFTLDFERDVARVFWSHRDSTIVIDVSSYRGKNLYEDLIGRDFTVNAMAVDFRTDLTPDMTELIDPLNGDDDLIQLKHLRQCSPSALADDPLRVMRAVRQSIAYGLRLEAQTKRAVRQHAQHLLDVSGERVRDEIFRMFGLEKVSQALRVMRALGVLDVVMPHVVALEGVPQSEPYTLDAWAHTLYALEKLQLLTLAISPRRPDQATASFGLGMVVMQLDRFRKPLQQHLREHWANDRPHIALLMLACVHHRVAGDNARERERIVANYADQLKLSNAEKKRLLATLNAYTQVLTLDADDVLSLHRFWFRWQEAGVDATLLAIVHELATQSVTLDQKAWLAQVERVVKLFWAYFMEYERVVSPTPLLDGNALIAEANVPEGRQVGELLVALREAQVKGEIATREQALAFARRWLTG